MKWWRIVSKALMWLDSHTPWEFVRVIKDREEDKDYLIRHYLISTRWLEPFIPALSYRVTLHKTLRSDIDGLHDHPWPWGSKILEGGYFEDTPEGKFWRDPSQGWRWRTANDFHRLILNPECKEETWSLFVMGPRQKDWGFLDLNGKWVQWQEYIGARRKNVVDRM